MHLITGIMNHNISSLSLQVVALLFLVVWTGFEAKGQKISTIAGTGNSGYNGDGKIATISQVDGLAGAAVSADGSIYISDFTSNRIRKVDANGIITTVAGTGRPGYSGDGGPATAAKLFGPSGLAFDKKGNLYFADNYNQRIRKVNLADGGTITTVAGCGEIGFSGNGGSATQARLQSPVAVAVDGSGNIFISDCDNNCIRKVNSAGIISAFAGDAIRSGTGTGSYQGDGKPAVNAQLNHPKGLAVDDNGNVFFADCFNHRIRKVAANGIISTVAGNGEDGFSGDRGTANAAQLNYPNGVAFDALGNLYISDHTNNRIRLVNKQGIINTIAGNGGAGFGGDGGDALSAEISGPTFIAVSPNGDAYIGDNGNSRIRMVSFTPQPSASKASVPQMKIQTVNTSHAAAN